jgi:acetoin utilization deacetylase AcuC-like enzyme
MSASKRTGYVFEELYMWHSPGNLPGSNWLEPTEHWENSATKRRFHNLIVVSELINHLSLIRARKATEQEILTVHTKEYHDKVKELSSKEGGCVGEQATFAKGGYDIAALSAGGVLAAMDAIIDGEIKNAYCLVRPPGHHAERDQGMGFCLFNNVAIAAMYARSKQLVPAIKKIAIIDYDVHHGNGTQHMFWNDPDTLFISLHQADNYPIGEGSLHEVGGAGAEGSNINIPMPPGSGRGAYRYAFDTVVVPALDRFRPDFVIVSSGFDASYADSLSAMMLSSDDYRYFTRTLMDVADRNCNGRILFAHEGGYSKDYVPFCGLAVVEELSGHRTLVEDHYLPEVSQWGFQNLQPAQAAAVDQAAMIHNLKPLLCPDNIIPYSENHALFLQAKHAIAKLESSLGSSVIENLKN